MKGMAYQYFCEIPMWAMALMLYFFVIGILFIIRDYFEKLPYNISVASQQGDWALIGIILIGVEITKRQSIMLPWLESWNNQIILLTASIIVGIVYHWVAFVTRKQSETIADTYHNLFVVPILVFMLGAAIPVISIYGEGYEKIISALLGWIWFLSLIFDIIQGRLQQTKWLSERGIELPLQPTPALFTRNGRNRLVPNIQK